MLKKISSLTVLLFFFAQGSFAQTHERHKSSHSDQSEKQASEYQMGTKSEVKAESPPLPDGMTLEEVLTYSDRPPPSHFPHAVMDNESYLFTLIEQLEYRIPDNSNPDVLGWEAQGWYGKDYDRFWWKSEGEAVFDGSEEGESENDFLYSRLVSPFWNLQVGAQYANEWTTSSYEDRWSGVIAFQGLAPYKFELDNSLYISEEADVTFSNETEYNIRIMQRLVLQPRVELQFAAQDIPERGLGAGMTDANIDLRLLYEIKRGFAPYIGARYRFLVAETEDIARAVGKPTEQWLFLAGLRLAF